jgi:hypothetical protein
MVVGRRIAEELAQRYQAVRHDGRRREHAPRRRTSTPCIRAQIAKAASLADFLILLAPTPRRTIISSTLPRSTP